MTQLARLAIKPLRIAFDDIKLKDTYCSAVRTAHRHGIKEISNYILFNYKDKPEDLYERLKINIELNRELGIQIFSFPMKYSPINRTDRSYIGVNWTKKSIRAISAILQVTKGVVAAGSDFFYKAFGNTLEEYFELLAMPRELIMFRHHFEENGTTAAWKKQYQAMSDEQKKELMEFTSHTVAELKQTPCPEQFQEILPYYLIKYNGKKDQLGDGAVQLSLMDEFVTPLVTQISWTNHLLIMSGSKTADERHFYMALCAKEHYSKRELERQIGTSYYERSMISAKKPMPESVSHDVRESILDTYVLEFLDLPEQFSEKNLRKAIIENLKQFILEFGRDFTFIGEEYRVQVGNTDFFIDLLFYNRALSCLVPIELKIGKFKPEHIGQINFYLEALDRDVKKPNENPSVGVILCASKDDAVVEYALSRSMSPTLVADYRLCLPDKTLLQNKLRELTELALESGEGNEGDED